MSLGAVRVGDFVKSICPDEDPPLDESGPFATGSSKVFVDGRPAVRVGDRPKPGPGPALTGSNKTIIDGRPAVRQKDLVECGVITQASNKTFYY